MNQEGHAVALLTGQATVEQRIAVLNRFVYPPLLSLSFRFNRFREGKERLMITTNVCARGIDIDQVIFSKNYFKFINVFFFFR